MRTLIFPRPSAHNQSPRWFAGAIGWILCIVCLATGCTTAPRAAVERPFHFQRDTLAFANELVWDYGFDASGRWQSRRHEPPPDYTHHCFVVARAVKQFFVHAEFDPLQSAVDEAAYRRLVREVVQRDPRQTSAPGRRVVIPGFAHLREFSAAHESLLKAGCGGAWESYVQRGHWRMLLPFSREHQAGTARRLAEQARARQPAVLHLVRFPQLTINHAVVVYGVRETPAGREFQTYDPNRPAAPVTLTYDHATRTFTYPQNDYFIGGRVDVHEVYHDWLY